MPDPKLTQPIHTAKLNRAIGDRVLEIRGSRFILVNRAGDVCTIRLADGALRSSGGTATLPTGQYQYQIYQMVAQRQSGWDFARGHPLI